MPVHVAKLYAMSSVLQAVRERRTDTTVNLLVHTLVEVTDGPATAAGVICDHEAGRLRRISSPDFSPDEYP